MWDKIWLQLVNLTRFGCLRFKYSQRLQSEHATLLAGVLNERCRFYKNKKKKLDVEYLFCFKKIKVQPKYYFVTDVVDNVKSKLIEKYK